MIVTEETARRIADALERLERNLPYIDYRGHLPKPVAALYSCEHCGSPQHHSLACPIHLSRLGGL